MTDINLESGTLELDDFPPETKYIRISYTTDGWFIRCYGDEKKMGLSNKITTLIPDSILRGAGNPNLLVRRDKVQE